MSESQFAAPSYPAAPAPAQAPQGGGNGYAPGYNAAPQTVTNPALGSLAPAVTLPQPAQPQYNPYQPQQQAPANPYGPAQSPYAPANPYQEANPYGAGQQPSPYVAPPGQISAPPLPYGTAPAGQPTVVPQNPAYQFNPYTPNPALQPQPVPGQPQAQQPAPQQQPQQTPAGQKLDVQATFPDQQSQAIYTGMDAVASGINLDLMQAFGPAYEARNPAYINEQYLAQFPPEKVQALKSQFAALISAGQARDQATIGSIHQMAGGQQQWDAAAAAFRNAPVDLRQRVASAMDSGVDYQIQLAAQAVLDYARQSGNAIVRQGQQFQPQGQGQAGAEVMTSERFGQHLDWLKAAHPVGSPEYNRHYDNLVAQRRVAKQQGY